MAEQVSLDWKLTNTTACMMMTLFYYNRMTAKQRDSHIRIHIHLYTHSWASFSYHLANLLIRLWLTPGCNRNHLPKITYQVN